MNRFTGSPAEGQFLEQVIARSGQDLRTCLQCGKCSGSCPIATDSVGGPRRLIAKILSGMQTEALSDPTWWYCVSCGSCATRCPVEINMYAVSTVLCEMAEEVGIAASEPDIHRFEELFLSSVEKNGRVRELNTVMAFNMKSLRPFADAAIGMRMAAKGMLSPAAILRRNRPDARITSIFAKIRQQQQKAQTP
jgi:heterodisulfide reductase subunit C